ncbi:serine/threonine protein kinase [Paractinoplanes abujensis]|uniref:non-specific serine/threonine protein kinase n=1 Tax=Paractinoplanes abujensis TaxID=882441 RepID=A0A7W7CQG7_9ACTN|nr:serine/threonine-protein kinase [Actinoplanes abujensis]MBB4692850.1 serine/threonine-protein kinase [Actinoplanes abujensis]GID22649.1 serine/threonine protein kinase [Actinoplanes abujensis]
MQKLAGRYRVGEALGHGGNSVVRYGFDTVLKRPVAIKMFDGSATEVLREARTAAGLSHPNIAQVYDYGELLEGDERTPYLVMEFVGGETLADRIARTGAQRWRRAAELGAETAGALAAAHAQDLVHRDVNPRNIMLTSDGVKVLDFGIAAVAGSGGGALWGSPAYVAPEQLLGEPTYPAGDVYALGLVLFEALTGAKAWPGETLGAVLATRHGRPAPRLPRLAGLPRDLVRLYEACTAEDPANRPTANDIAETLRRLGHTAPLARPAFAPVRLGLPPAATPAVTPVRPALSPVRYHAAVSPAAPAARRRSRRRVTVIGSAAVVTAILSIIGVQLLNGTATPGGREAEAAIEAVDPPATSAKPSAAPQTPLPTTRTRQTNDTKTVTVRKKLTPTDTPSSATPKGTPSSPKPTTPPAKPTKPPATPKPPQQPPAQPPTTPPVDPTTPPVDPTTQPTTPPPDPTTPPATTAPETPAEAGPEV